MQEDAPGVSGRSLRFKLRYFIELSEELAIPERAIVTIFHGDWPMAEVVQEEILLTEGHPVPDDRPGKAIVSLQFTRWEVERLERILPTASLVLNRLLHTSDMPQRSTGLRESVSLVEALTLSSSVDSSHVSNAFDRCIEALGIFLDNYQVIAETVITPIRPERMRVPIPYAVSNLDQRPLWSDEGWQFGGLYHSAMAAVPPPETPQTDVDIKMLERMQTRRSRHVRGDLLMRAQELGYRARRALSIDGDFDSAVIAVQMQVELLADAVLGLRMWEEGASPQEAVNALEDRDVQRKVAGRFQQRLKGDWDARTSVVRDWHDDLYQLRNRIIHRGHYPSLDEVKCAFRAAQLFTDHLLTCLYDRRHAYPKSALLVLGRPTLEDRGTWHGKVKRVLESEADSQPNWLDSYVAWRRAVEVERDRRASQTDVTKS